MVAEVWGIGPWKNNAELMVDVARLGYLGDDTDVVLDATYGEGAFWNLHVPPNMVTNDLHKPANCSFNYTNFPEEWANLFEIVVYDPPYKLQGTPRSGAFDDRYGLTNRVRENPDDFDKWYGVGQSVPWQERMENIRAGAVECYRVCSRFLLVKCQDQVASGSVRWQTDLITNAILEVGGIKKDRFDLVSAPRPQPGSRKQAHARRNHSTLLVFRKP